MMRTSFCITFPSFKQLYWPNGSPGIQLNPPFVTFNSMSPKRIHLHLWQQEYSGGRWSESGPGDLYTVTLDPSHDIEVYVGIPVKIIIVTNEILRSFVGVENFHVSTPIIMAQQTCDLAINPAVNITHYWLTRQSYNVYLPVINRVIFKQVSIQSCDSSHGIGRGLRASPRAASPRAARTSIARL